jgi:hypothetical protein
MKRRLVVPLAGLAISFALPIYAQQNDVADPETTQKIGAIFKALSEAQENHDPAAYAAIFTSDAVFVTPKGPIIGRASHSEILYRPVAVVAPHSLRRQVGRECFPHDRYGWQRSEGDWRMD